MATNPNPSQLVVFSIEASGVVTSTNGEPVPDNTIEEQS